MLKRYFFTRLVSFFEAKTNLRFLPGLSFVEGHQITLKGSKPCHEPKKQVLSVQNMMEFLCVCKIPVFVFFEVLV